MSFVAPLRIGSLELRSNLCLAPLAGYTSLAFRRMVREIAPIGLATTEVVSAKALCARARNTLALLRTAPGDRPLAIQIQAAVPEEARDAAQFLEAQGFAAVDLNLGCPVRKIAKKGGGAALARSADDAAAVARAAAGAVRIPVTAKMRLGWAEGDLTAPDVARALEAAGVAAVAVHGRTRAQSFGGAVDRAGIRAVVEAVRAIPVLGNGDIDSPGAARRMFEETGCAGLLIGRAAVVDPFLFRAIADEGAAPPAAAERLAALGRHFALLAEDEGEALAARQFRKVLRLFGRAFGAGARFHEAAGAVAGAADVRALLDGFAARIGPDAPLAATAAAVPVPATAVDLW